MSIEPEYSFILKKKDLLNLDILKTRLVQAGYRAVKEVREHGEFAIRGSLIDLFPMGSRTPFRIDLFDNEVETFSLYISYSEQLQECHFHC